MQTNSEFIFRMLFRAKCKMAPMGPQNGQQDLERGSTLGYLALKVIWRSKQLLLNRFFDPSTPSMRNIEPPTKSKMAARGP